MNILLWTVMSIFITFLILIHSKLFGVFGIENISVNGNYEFTKVSFFNIIFPLFFLFTLLGLFLNKRKKIEINTGSIGVYIFYLLISISIIFSSIPYTSIFGGVDKGHGLFFLTNLYLFYITINILIQNTHKKYGEYLLMTIGLSISIIGLYEYIFPSFNYGDLGNRLLGTLGHPNYVSGILIILFPYFIYRIKNKKLYGKHISIFIFSITFISLILTKSFIAIFLFLSFLLYIVLGKKYKKYYYLLLTTFCLLGLILIFIVIPEKFNSFISRYYIWETVVKILFSDIKIFLLGIGAENLPYYFDIYKSSQIYLFENIGFTADRPHNIFLHIWISYGIIPLILLLYFIKKIIIKSINNSWHIYSLGLGLVFWSFNFPNIIGYITYIIILVLYLHQNKEKYINNKSTKVVKLFHYIFIILLFFISSIGSYYSYYQYRAEIEVKKNNYSEAIKYFDYSSEYWYNIYNFVSGLKKENNFYTEQYYLYRLYYSFEKAESCNTLVNNYGTIENYFYCGQLIEEKYGFEKAMIYYQKGLDLFPDIFSQNNIYTTHKILRRIINTERILHRKYSEIKKIINKMNTGKNI